jgi:PhnB protein
MDLCDLPRVDFKAELKADLERTSSMTTLAEHVAVSPTVSPQLRLRNAAAAIDFYKEAFGAREIMRFDAGGRVAHAELAIGNSVIMLGEEAPEYGFPSPDALGGSPVGIHLYVDDADAFVERAVAAGARLVSPVKDEFYGDRVGSVGDPFGYSWTIAARKESLSVDEMHRRFEQLTAARGSERPPAAFIRTGFHTVTPYLIVQDAPALLDFVNKVFAAEEMYRGIGSAGGVHAELRIGDSMVMIGGGGRDLAWKGESRLAALHVYVDDTDAVFRRAVDAGATAIQEPADQEYGERSGSVRDREGNHWYIATAEGAEIPEGLHTVNTCLHPLRAEPVISFLKRAFGAEEVEKYASPEGVIHHAKVRIGTSPVELGEAHGPYQPMRSTFYLYVPDVDAMYRRALEAGGTSTGEPVNQPYGDRTASVQDAFGNQWYIATHMGSR